MGNCGKPNRFRLSINWRNCWRKKRTVYGFKCAVFSEYEVKPSLPECSVLEYSVVRDAWEQLSVPSDLLKHMAECFYKHGAMAYCSQKSKLYVVTNDFMVCAPVRVDNEDITIDK